MSWSREDQTQLSALNAGQMLQQSRSTLSCASCVRHEAGYLIKPHAAKRTWERISQHSTRCITVLILNEAKGSIGGHGHWAASKVTSCNARYQLDCTPHPNAEVI